MTDTREGLLQQAREIAANVMEARGNKASYLDANMIRSGSIDSGHMVQIALAALSTATPAPSSEQEVVRLRSLLEAAANRLEQTGSRSSAAAIREALSSPAPVDSRRMG